MRKRVFCTFQVPGFHQWVEAPEEYSYLRHVHRHLFHVRVEVSVSFSNRQVEFIALKADATIDFIRLGEASDYQHGIDFGNNSCEMLAEALGDKLIKQHGLEVKSVEVSEDGENGSVVLW